MGKTAEAFSAAGQLNHSESRIGNAGVTLMLAQKEQLRLNEAARLKVADKKSEAQLKVLEKARAALAKHEFDAQSLTEKD